MSWNRTKVLVLLGAVVLSGVVPAIPVADEVKPFTTDELIIGRKIVVDKAFTDKIEAPEPSPFELVLPTADGFLTLMDTKNGGYVKFTFATPERGFLENLHLVDMNIPAGDDAEQRIKIIAKLLAEQAFANAVKGYAESKRLAVRKTRIGELAAVEVLGTYTDPANGKIYLRIVGLPHPTEARGTYAVINIHAGRVPLKVDSEFAETLSGRALASFRYLE